MKKEKVRYPMCKDQSAQIDCRVKSCTWYEPNGICCTNVSPAITLNESGKFTCWSKNFTGFNDDEK